MTTQHTPASWSADDEGFIIANKTGTSLAHVLDYGRLDDREVAANIRLICAAPDLLAALMRCERIVIAHADSTGDTEALTALRDALRKALTGEGAA